jgi:uncharacterized membrane protein
LASRLYNAFAAASGTWMVLLVLAPFLASRAHASALGTGLVVAVYAAGSIVCHQLPARSVHLWTAQLPVCARCTGIYFGAAAMAIAVHRSALRPLVVGRLALRTVMAAAAPTLVTLAYEWTTGSVPANWIRFAAGIPIGVAVAWLVRSAAENQVN